MKAPRLPEVIVAIPAFNEAANLPFLLPAILTQKRPNFILRQVWVVSDGCTDATVAIARSFGPPVKVFAHHVRRGKPFRLNQIAARFKADVLVQIDADMKIKSNKLLSQIVAPFSSASPPDLVLARLLALPPTTWVGKAAFFGFRLWDHARVSLGKAALRYYCEGGLRAFSARFIGQFCLPAFVISEDSFSFYFAVTRGFKVVFAPRARVYVKLPATLPDYLKQMVRSLSAPGQMARFFPPAVIARYEVITPQVKVKSFVVMFIKSPFVGLIYGLIQLLAKLKKLFYRPLAIWDVAQSTKTTI